MQKGLNMDDEWKDIEGFEGLYQVSKSGRVKGLDRVVRGYGRNKRITVKGVVIVGSLDKRGYRNIGLMSGGVRKRSTKIHRLVAEAFIPNPENKPQVNHLDMDKTNNCVENLEWCTNLENRIHAKENGPPRNMPKGELNKASKLTKEAVILCREMYEWSENNSRSDKVKAFTMSWLAKCFKVSGHAMRNAIRRKTWGHV